MCLKLRDPENLSSNKFIIKLNLQTWVTVRSFMGVCAKCGQESKKLYDCEHTDSCEYCVECYTELHYYLTEHPKKDENQ